VGLFGPAGPAFVCLTVELVLLVAGQRWFRRFIHRNVSRPFGRIVLVARSFLGHGIVLSA
jgi:hypothetical protein